MSKTVFNIRKTARKLINRYCCVPMLRKNKRLIDEADKILNNIIIHFEQDFRYQLEHHIHIVAIYDYITNDNNFKQNLFDLRDVFYCHMNKNYRYSISITDKNFNNFLLLADDIDKFIKEYICINYNYKLLTIDTLITNNINIDKLDLINFQDKNDDNELLFAIDN